MMIGSWLAKIPRPIFKPSLALQTLKYSLGRENSYDLMRIFGIFGLIHTPLIYFVGLSYKGISVIETRLRIINLLLFIPLVFINHWPTFAHRLKQYYWFFTVTFVLPFFATFMFIFNNGSHAWFTKITVALLWMVLVTSWGVFLLCLIVGVMFGILVYGAVIDSSFSEFSLSWAELINSFWIVIVASIFSSKREEIVRSKIESMRSLAGAIAHEMRTPLFGIRSASAYLSQKLPKMIEKYKGSHQGNLSEKEQLSIERILKTPDKIDAITRSTFTIIDMLLTNLKGVNGVVMCTKCSIHSIIQTALERYPLSNNEKKTIHYKQTEDFQIYGNQDLLVQVLFNLMKNALHYTKEAGKGEIFIWLKEDEDFITLFFQDTGKGISEKLLPFIFEPYYSSTKYGTGIGLHFCKQVIDACGGEMTCRSIENVETTFKINLKKYRNEDINCTKTQTTINKL